MLGLGIGGQIATLYKAFPSASLTIIEIDEAMISLCDKVHLYRPHARPRIIHANAHDFIRTTKETFDLVVVDMFVGRNPDTHFSEEKEARELHRITSRNGLIVINAYENTDYLGRVSKTHHLVDQWKYKLNHLALFSAIPVGNDFTHRYQWPEYLACVPSLARVPAEVLTTPLPGTRKRLGPLVVEQYTGDTAPEEQTPTLPYPHFVVMEWQRVLTHQHPRGWHTVLFDYSITNGYTTLTDTYQSTWSESARRDLKKMQQLKDRYEIVTLTLEQCTQAYRKSDTFRKIGSYLLDEFIKIATHSPDSVSLWGVQDLRTNDIVAGLGTLDSKECKGSYYHLGFTVTQETSAPMTALIDVWHDASVRKGFVYLHYGAFWRKGNPSSFKGFTGFKQKFAPWYLLSPLPLYKILFHFPKKPR